MKHYNLIKGRCWLGSILIATLLVLFVVKRAFAIPLGNVTDFKWNASTKMVEFSAGTPNVRVIFYKDDVFRIWVSSSAGIFSDAASEQLVVWEDDPISPTIDESNADYYLIKTSDCALRVYKTPCKFGLFDANNSNPVFEESAPINLGGTTVQSIKRQSDEDFYGCGAWNGKFCLTNLTAPAKYSQNYKEGGSPNPATMYTSRLGYCAFRNTWDNRGSYNFGSTVTTSHGEDRFDCYYSYGPSIKKALRGYTDITGKINFPPIWALELGIAGRFDAASAPLGTAEANAAKFADYDVPFGWWFPNDSYQSTLDNVEKRVGPLKAMNEWCGCWCGSAFNNAATKDRVLGWGVSGFKLDCSWIGGGGIKCFKALMSVGPDGLEQHNDGRSYQWTTAGWSGSQRFSHAWTGDQSSSMDWIRWNVITGIGGAMSAMQGVTSDLDAIFDGSSPEAQGSTTYVRSWFWQMWTPFLYLMDGWSGSKGRLPWNRCPSYIAPVLKPTMKLRTRLTPYMYTLLADAYETGVSANRPALMEFPEDKTTWDNGTSSDPKTLHSFMLGPWFYVRPIHEKTSSNTKITLWLPGTADENWIEYYSGKVSAGAQNVQCEVGDAPNTYNASKPPAIPVWVREGAIIPMWPAQYWSNEILIRPNNPGNTLKNSTTDVKGPWTFDIYPHRSRGTEFNMYEDDGLTKQYKTGKSARTLITSKANGGRYTVNIGAAVGDYTDKPATKTYMATIHTGIIQKDVKPDLVKIDGVVVAEKSDSASLVSSSEGWWWNSIKDGIVYVKTQEISTSSSVAIQVDISVTGLNPDAGITDREVLNKFSVFCTTGKLRLSFANMFTGKMKASIYNLHGKLVVDKMIDVKQSKAGVWNTAVSGTYILKLEYKGITASRKFTVRK